ncbi:MAG TPA: DNA-binding domain-containing protein [Dokdonella sp.]|uniref:DNA-binding domain-containing protein n=1 Tax=Dokdonella sp. TaxID=2291710 RepID=UPI002CB743E8|nr:DNA-binding domain-containing protein [Dokdonella sp.]HUD42815.1 DNA-binding domain-containing protein [Dokdonella sp.]
MTTLHALQRQFAACLVDGDTALSAAVRATPDADATLRLDVYAHAYRQRLHEVLAEEFPALAATAGADTFAAWTARCARERPSRDPNLRWYGAAFADWLREAAAAPPVAAALAGFEWALSIAFDAKDLPALEAERLAALPAAHWPALRLSLHPQLVLLPAAWNLEAIRRAVDAGQEPPPPTAAPGTLAIWRRQRQVRYRRLDAEEAAALDALRQGLPFGALCEALAGRYGAAAAPRAAQALRDWIEAGWIAAPDGDALGG